MFNVYFSWSCIRTEGVESLSLLDKIEDKRSRGRQRSTISGNSIRWFGNNINCNDIFRKQRIESYGGP